MVVGFCLASTSQGGLSRRTCVGNKGIHWAARGPVGRSFTDIFSGYRVFRGASLKAYRFCRRGSRSKPISVHALELRASRRVEIYACRGPRLAPNYRLYLRRLADPRRRSSRSAESNVRCCSVRSVRWWRRCYSQSRWRAYLNTGFGAAGPDRDFEIHRDNHRRGAVLLRRTDPRHRHARPPRSPPPRLPVATRALRRRGPKASLDVNCVGLVTEPASSAATP